jgi:hypothetical protein
MADFKSAAVREMWMASAECQDCGEQNEKGKKPMIEVNELAAAVCNKCGHEWKVNE